MGLLGREGEEEVFCGGAQIALNVKKRKEKEEGRGWLGWFLFSLTTTTTQLGSSCGGTHAPTARATDSRSDAESGGGSLVPPLLVSSHFITLSLQRQRKHEKEEGRGKADMQATVVETKEEEAVSGGCN